MKAIGPPSPTFSGAKATVETSVFQTPANPLVPLREFEALSSGRKKLVTDMQSADIDGAMGILRCRNELIAIERSAS